MKTRMLMGMPTVMNRGDPKMIMTIRTDDEHDDDHHGDEPICRLQHEDDNLTR